MEKKPEMNKRRLDIVAKWLEGGAKEKHGVAHFDMRDWKCGSVCCIGGAAQQFFGRDSDAGELLGLDAVQEHALFYPNSSRAHASTPKEAAKVVRHLIHTGVVDWGILRHLPQEQIQHRFERMDKTVCRVIDTMGEQ